MQKLIKHILLISLKTQQNVLHNISPIEQSKSFNVIKEQTLIAGSHNCIHTAQSREYIYSAGTIWP